MTDPRSFGPQPGPGALQGRPPGSKAIKVGVVLLAISVLVGLIGSRFTLGRLDESSLTRDVVISGDRFAEVPGEIDFEVAETISERAPSRMTVAVLSPNISDWSGRCAFTDSRGRTMDSGSVVSTGGYIHPNDMQLEPVEVAELEPGTYTASCEERSDRSSAPRFTIGRVIGPSDLTSGELSPLLWFGVVLLISGALFVTGLIVLIVGLVKRRKSRRSGMGPGPYGWNQPGHGSVDQQGWPPAGPPGSYGHPGPPQPGSYGHPGPPQPGPYGHPGHPGPPQPGPYQPGPYDQPRPDPVENDDAARPEDHR